MLFQFVQGLGWSLRSADIVVRTGALSATTVVETEREDIVLQHARRHCSLSYCSRVLVGPNDHEFYSVVCPD